MVNRSLSSRSILLAGGGTAGHVNPLLATAEALRSVDSHFSLTVVGTSSGLETELVPAAGFTLELIERVPFPRKINIDAVKFFGKFWKAIRQAGKIIDDTNADTVVGFGGYVSPPVYLAAKKRKLRIVVHEGNARPGVANKLGARFADVVALSFKNTPLAAKSGDTVLTGLPLRSQISTLQNEREDLDFRKKNAAKYGLDASQPILVVTGGSLGAQHINEVTAQCAKQILDAGFQILHICGKGKISAKSAQLATNLAGYQVLEYAMQMDEIYSFADLIITRAGAGMVSEIAALGIPAVFVPLPIGNGEQALNAAELVEAGGAILIADKDFSEETVKKQVLPLFNDSQLSLMKKCAQNVAHTDAAMRLAKLILN